MAMEYYSFEKVLAELDMEEDELRRLAFGDWRKTLLCEILDPDLDVPPPPGWVEVRLLLAGGAVRRFLVPRVESPKCLFSTEGPLQLESGGRRIDPEDDLDRAGPIDVSVVEGQVVFAGLGSGAAPELPESLAALVGEGRLAVARAEYRVGGGEIRAFRDGDEIRFKKSDIDGLKKGRMTEPTIILASSGGAIGDDDASEVLLEDEGSETLLDLDDDSETPLDAEEGVPVIDFTDHAATAPRIAPPVGSARGGPLVGAVPPAGQQAPEEKAPPADDGLRRTTVRYYSQMNPLVSFPLLVVVSERAIREIARDRVAQVEGKRRIEVSKAEPEIEIVPNFPGCLVVPGQATLDITPRRAEALFHVTPLAEGDIPRAHVLVRRGKKVLDRIETPSRVSKQTLAKVTLSLSIASPVVSTFLDVFDLSVRDELPALVVWLGRLVDLVGGRSALGFLLMGALLGAAGFFYWRNRPRESEPVVDFLDVETS